jgi:hypothetical protein
MTKTTLQVLCNLTTPTPLSDVLSTCTTGTWRMRSDIVETLTHVEVFDESTNNKIVGSIDEITYKEKTDTMGSGYSIKFTPIPNREGSVVRSYGSTRPKFNMIGWNIKTQ